MTITRATTRVGLGLAFVGAARSATSSRRARSLALAFDRAAVERCRVD